MVLPQMYSKIYSANIQVVKENNRILRSWGSAVLRKGSLSAAASVGVRGTWVLVLLLCDCRSLKSEFLQSLAAVHWARPEAGGLCIGGQLESIFLYPAPGRTFVVFVLFHFYLFFFLWEKGLFARSIRWGDAPIPLKDRRWRELCVCSHCEERKSLLKITPS